MFPLANHDASFPLCNSKTGRRQQNTECDLSVDGGQSARSVD